jgi:hypothetical protein
MDGALKRWRNLVFRRVGFNPPWYSCLDGGLKPTLQVKKHLQSISNPITL